MPNRVLSTVWDWRNPVPKRTGPPRAARGLLQTLVLAAVAALFHFGLGHRVPAMIAASLAVLVLVSSLAIPPIFRGIEAFGRWLGRVVGGALTYVLLVPVWLLIFVPGGLLLRLQSRDPLHRSLRDDADSYWIPRRKRPDRATYERQFLVEDREARSLRRPVGSQDAEVSR